MEVKAIPIIPIRLDVLDLQGQIQYSFEFTKEKIVLGRVLSADLRVDNPKVSRIHALLEVRADQILITDLASSLGTFVNGKKIIESKLQFGDTIRLGVVDIRLQKGSGQITNFQLGLEKLQSKMGDFRGEQTQVDLEVEKIQGPSSSLEPQIEGQVSLKEEKRKKDLFPEEKRLEERRSGDRRVEERSGEDRRKKQSRSIAEPGVGEDTAVEKERRSGVERRVPLEYERRVGERRRGDRRIFDLTSLERRIEERRSRNSTDDILPEELEKAFETPNHIRELEVTVLWGDYILDVSNYYEPITLTIGESPNNHYVIPSEGIPEEFPLITIEQDGNASLTFTDRMQGTVRTRDRVYSLSEVINEKFVRRTDGYFVLSLKQDDFVKLQVGTIHFFALYVRPAPRIRAAPLFGRDPLVIRTFFGSLLLLGLFIFGLGVTPKPKPVTIEMMPERFAKIVIKKRPDLSKMGIVVKGAEEKTGGSQKGEGGASPGAEGEAGKKEKETVAKKPDKPQNLQQQTQAKPKPEEAPKPKVTETKSKPAPQKPTERERKVVEQDRAKSVGLLKAFSSSGIQKDLKNVLKSSDSAESGFDDFGKSVSGLRGKGIEETAGVGGKGLKGINVGGGGKTIGIDGPSTKGLGRGTKGDGIGEGIGGPGRLGMKGEAAVSIVAENVQVLSGLPRDIVNAVVQRHRSEIRACYDAALQRNPSLRGKVAISFLIQASGVVSTASVKESTVNDGGLEGCILSRVKTWVFPKPEAPVVTEVSSFPFFFSPTN